MDCKDQGKHLVAPSEGQTLGPQLPKHFFILFSVILNSHSTFSVLAFPPVVLRGPAVFPAVGSSQVGLCSSTDCHSCHFCLLEGRLAGFQVHMYCLIHFRSSGQQVWLEILSHLSVPGQSHLVCCLVVKMYCIIID